MGTAAVLLGPANEQGLLRLGNGDRKKTRSYMLAIAAFLEGKPENTKLAYRSALRQFFELFDWISPEQVTVAEAAYFKKWLMKRGLADATVYARMSALQSFFDFLSKPHGAAAEPLIKNNPFRLITRTDVKPTPYGRSVPVEWDNLQKCLDAIPADATGMRDKAVLLFFAFTGRRRSEIANLRIGDLNLQAKPPTYTVKAKGNKTQTYEMPEIVLQALRAYWLAAGRVGQLHPDAGVFTPSVDGALTATLDPDRPISGRLVTAILKRAAQRAGVNPDQMRVHGLRHMAARDLDKAGVRLQDIQAFLGHATPNTTSIYINALNRRADTHEDVLLRVRSVAKNLGEELLRDAEKLAEQPPQ